MIRRWLPLTLASAVAITLLALVGAPAAALLGALVGGLVVSLAGSAPAVPAPAGTVGQAVIGVSVGTLVSGDLVDTFARDGWVIAAALAATLLSSLAWGQVLRLQPGVSSVTAGFAAIAGGASGVVATAREAGADEPVVATIQYLRVLVVLFSLPVVAGLFHATGSEHGTAPSTSGGTWSGYLFAALAVVVGLAGARLLRFPGAAVVLPMVVSAALAAVGWIGAASLPTLVLDAAYVVIGVQVGLKFTRDTGRTIARLLPLALVQVAGTIVTCALIGLAMARLTGMSSLDAYLATTPGGLYAVVAIALSTGGDTGLVFSLQILRLFAALLLVPVLTWLTNRAPRPDGRAEPEATES